MASGVDDGDSEVLVLVSLVAVVLSAVIFVVLKVFAEMVVVFVSPPYFFAIKM